MCKNNGFFKNKKIICIFEYCSYIYEHKIRKYVPKSLYRTKAMGHPARMAILRFLAGQDSCFFGDIHEVLPIAKATVSQHLKELKAAGLIQGEIEAPKVRYCINRENWAKARESFADFFCEYRKKGSCCG